MPTLPVTASEPREPDLRPLLWLVALAVFMQMLDSTIVNTALPAMARALGESPLQMQAVVFSYSLAMAMVIPASGWLADSFGTRRVFLLAITGFSFGSLCCALASDLPSLVGARVLQGLGGACLLPVGRLSVLRSVPRARFLAAMSFIAIPAMVGPLLGPTVGGWLVQVASWHWVFLINLPIGLCGLLVAWKVMPDHRGGQTRGFDLPGYLLLAGGMIALSLALDGVSASATSTALVLLLALGGLAALCGYWLHAAHAAHPLFPLALFEVPAFRIGLLGNLFARIGAGAMPLLVPLMLQLGAGLAPMHAGMMMIPMTLAGMASKRLSVRLVTRFGYRRVLMPNTLLVGLMMASFALFDSHWPLWLQLLQLGVFGALNALQFTAMNTVTLRDLDDARASAGNSLLSMVMMLANGFGVAAAGSLLAAFGSAAAGTSLPAALQGTFACVGAITALSTLIFVQLPDRPARPQPGEDIPDPAAPG